MPGAQQSVPELKLEPVAGRIGAEVLGVTLSDSVDDATVAGIRAALLKYKVIFFRNQHHLDDAAHEAFATRMGNPIAHPTAPAAARFLLDLKTSEGYAASVWHTDMTFMPAYPEMSILRALVVPAVGGDTMWANTASAYADLPEPLRLLVDNLRAIHSNIVDFDGTFDKIADRLGAYRTQPPSKIFETEHPVVGVHPETGERTLILGQFLNRFVGLTLADSHRLLDILQDHVTKPENVVRWRWRLGDVAIWDNRATQHRSVADYGDQPRHMRRATIHGTTAVGIDGTESRQLRMEETAEAA